MVEQGRVCDCEVGFVGSNRYKTADSHEITIWCCCTGTDLRDADHGLGLGCICQEE